MVDLLSVAVAGDRHDDYPLAAEVLSVTRSYLVQREPESAELSQSGPDSAAEVLSSCPYALRSKEVKEYS